MVTGIVRPPHEGTRLQHDSKTTRKRLLSRTAPAPNDYKTTPKTFQADSTTSTEQLVFIKTPQRLRNDSNTTYKTFPTRLLNYFCPEERSSTPSIPKRPRNDFQTTPQRLQTYFRVSVRGPRETAQVRATCCGHEPLRSPGGLGQSQCIPKGGVPWQS